MRRIFLKTVAFLLAVCSFCLTLTGCHKHNFQRIVREDLLVSEATYEHANIYKMSCECGEVSDKTFQNGSLLKYEVGSKSSALDGKKILIVGNSYTYNGNVVLKTDKKLYYLDENRLNDQGYFYHLCRENGADISVTDWCFGSHGYYDIFSNKCKDDGACRGVDHLGNLTDKYYDYVVLQDGGWKDKYMGDEGYIEYVKNVMQMFKDANPNVKFYYSFQPAIIFQANDRYEDGSEKYPWRDTLKTLEEEAGLYIVDWGTLIYDIWTGATKVPNSKYEYNKESFIVSKSKADGYHQNMLSGYITSVMLYCAITGETAVGQPYKFATDTTLNSSFFNTVFYKYEYYTYVKETNFDLILKDGEEIANIQKVIDNYVGTQQYTKYCN